MWQNNGTGDDPGTRLGLITYASCTSHLQFPVCSSHPLAWPADAWVSVSCSSLNNKEGDYIRLHHNEIKLLQ